MCVHAIVTHSCSHVWIRFSGSTKSLNLHQAAYHTILAARARSEEALFLWYTCTQHVQNTDDHQLNISCHTCCTAEHKGGYMAAPHDPVVGDISWCRHGHMLNAHHTVSYTHLLEPAWNRLHFELRFSFHLDDCCMQGEGHYHTLFVPRPASPPAPEGCWISSAAPDCQSHKDLAVPWARRYS